METRGFGHQPVVDGLVPQLIGLERRRERLVGPAKIAASPPIIEIVGGRLAGKTLLLEELYEGYRNRIPLAYLDLTDPRLVSRAVPRRYAATASPTVRVLYTLAYLLGRYVPGFGELHFQRLLLGLLVVSVWHPDHSDEQVLPEDLQGAEADLRRFLRRVHDRDPERKTPGGAQPVGACPQPGAEDRAPLAVRARPGAQHAVRAVVAMVTSQLRASRLHDRAVSWWGQRLRTDLGFQGDDLECLFDLARHFPPRGGRSPAGRRCWCARCWPTSPTTTVRCAASTAASTADPAGQPALAGRHAPSQAAGAGILGHGRPGPSGDRDHHAGPPHQPTARRLRGRRPVPALAT